MTNEELAEARRLCEGATPGPWESEPDSDSVGVSDAIFKERGYGLLAGADHPGTAAFIAASRTLVPRLLAALVAARNALDEETGAARAWALAGQAVSDLFDPMKHRADASTMLLVATAAKAAHLQVRAERDAFRARELLENGLPVDTELDRWRNSFICLECGRCSVDEDGLCVTCGGDCLGFQDGKLVMKIEPSAGPELSATRAEIAQLKADLVGMRDGAAAAVSLGLPRGEILRRLGWQLDALIGKAGPL